MAPFANDSNYFGPRLTEHGQISPLGYHHLESTSRSDTRRNQSLDDRNSNRDRRVALCLAASYLDGDKRQELLREAESLKQKTGKSLREREIANLRKWSENPNNPNVRQVGPATILKNIFSLEKLDNPAAEIFYTILALWRHSSPDHSEPLLSYLEKAGKHAMKYRDKEFVEFLRRSMDFPRRGLLDVSKPNFLDLIDNTVASSSGATVYLPPETFIGIKLNPKTYPKSYAKRR